VDNPYGVDVRYEWEQLPNRFHAQWLKMAPFRIDKYPVTQTQFFDYLRSGKGVLPKDTWHYLHNWDWNASAGGTGGRNGLPKPFPGNEDKPVTYLGLDEARAFCAAYGKRLPREEEWQLSGQGFGSRRQFPWRTDPSSLAAFIPAQQHGTRVPGPEPVDKHSPQADSVFGVGDLVGNVWQFTDEYQDGHTRSVVLRGGSNYRPAGSIWYFPNDPSLITHNKYFLMNPRYERGGTVGFRCAADASPQQRSEANSGCNASLCVSFDAPRPTVWLRENAKEFALWGAAGTAIATRSPGPSRLIGEAQAGSGGLEYCSSVVDGWVGARCEAALRETCGRGSGCSGCLQKNTVALGDAGCSVAEAEAFCSSAPSQTSFVYGVDQAGAEQLTASGVCVNATARGAQGITLNVSSPGPNKRATLTLYAGVVGGSHTLRAFLIDGAKTTRFSLTANATQYDLDGAIPTNLAWRLEFMASSPAAMLLVEIAATVPDMSVWLPPPPPPPPPPVPPCMEVLCVGLTQTVQAVAPAKGNNHPNLTEIGRTDWAHFGTAPGYFTGSPTAYSRKCNVPVKSLIGNVVVVGPNKGQQSPAYANNPTTATWTGDGGWSQAMPTSGQLLSVSESPTGIYMLGSSAVPNAGGFAVNVSIPHRTDAKPVVVSVFAGSCSTRGTISARLLAVGSGGAVLSSYSHTTNKADGGACSWNVLFTFSIPPAAAAAPRELAIVWEQAEEDAGVGNLQFNSIAVDAGEPRREGELVPCGKPQETTRTTMLQAAIVEY
jgi:formylglycine-generating enzyme required for sulfatase activity